MKTEQKLRKVLRSNCCDSNLFKSVTSFKGVKQRITSTHCSKCGKVVSANDNLIKEVLED